MVGIKKIFIAIVAVVAGTNAAVLTRQETFNDVKVISPAKSTQTTCKTRVDLSEGLVDNTLGCDIEKILVFNKNRMWIGTLHGVEAGYHSRYNDYDVDRYKGKGYQISIVYAFTPQNADPSNRWMVSCPKGMTAYIEDDYYRCTKPFECPAGMYAVDSLECAELQEGAHRNSTIGFSCNKGYFMNADGFCIEKAICGKNEAYDKTENTCIERPEHSHWIKNSLEWECDGGYVMQGDICEEIIKCDSESRYYAATNTCVVLPEFAYWNDSVSTEWTCNTGYVLNGAGCEEKAVCSSEQRYDASTNICVDPFPNSRWTGWQDGYACNTGYVDLGYGKCVKKVDCAHYNADDNSCYEKPEHSHWLYSWGNAWECDAGFHQGSNVCFQCSDETQFDSDVGECVAKPSNSHWISEGKWSCDDGFVKMNEFCEEKASCGWRERYDSDNNTCVTKPSHSHWIAEWDYECDNGYALDYNGECYDTNPINLMDYTHFTHDIGMDFGGGSFKDNYDETQPLMNIGLDYNAGVKLGVENFNVRIQGAVALLYTTFEYTHNSGSSYFTQTETISAVLALLGLNVGLDLWRLAFDYSCFYVEQGDLDNIKYSSALHKIRIGAKISEHWKIHLAVIPNLISSTTVMKSYDNTWFHLGMTYRI